MTITRDAMRAVHLGERLDEGVVTWSGNTLDKTLALITAKTTDAVATFLDPGYVQRAVRAMETGRRAPGRRPAGGGPDGVSQRLRFTDAQQTRHPDPLHPRRRRHRGRGHARGHQRRPDPATTPTPRTRWSPWRCAPSRSPPLSEPVPAHRPRRHAAAGPFALSSLLSGGLPCLIARSRRCGRARRPATPTPPRSTTSTRCSPASDPGDGALADIALILARTGRPMIRGPRHRDHHHRDRAGLAGGLRRVR